MPLHRPVEKAQQNRQMQVSLRCRPAQADEVLPDHGAEMGPIRKTAPLLIRKAALPGTIR